MRFTVSQKDIYMLCIYTWGFQITLKKKSLSKWHDKLLSPTHIMQFWGGGEKLKVHSPLSWQQLFIYFVLCLCLFLFLFIFTKSLKSLPRSTSSVTDIKMPVSSPLLSVSYRIVLSLPLFFSSLFHWVQKRREKRVVFYLYNCHKSRLFDGGARIIIWWSWVHSTGQQVKLLTRHGKG